MGKTDQISVQLNGIDLDEVKEYKYLGLFFDRTLTWENHADKLGQHI